MHGPIPWPQSLLFVRRSGHGAAVLMKPVGPGILRAHRVDPAVNSNRAEGPQLIEPERAIRRGATMQARYPCWAHIIGQGAKLDALAFQRPGTVGHIRQDRAPPMPTATIERTASSDEVAKVTSGFRLARSQ